MDAILRVVKYGCDTKGSKILIDKSIRRWCCFLCEVFK